LDAITCVGFKVMVQYGMVADPTCVTLEEFTSAMPKLGLTESSQTLFAGGASALVAAANSTCFDMVSVDGYHLGEHFMDSGIIDPYWNKTRFEEIFGKKHDDDDSHDGKKGKRLVGLESYDEFEMLSNFQARVLSGTEVVGGTVTIPGAPLSVLIDSIGVDPEPLPTGLYSKVLEYDDMENLFKKGKLPKASEKQLYEGGIPEASTRPTFAFEMSKMQTFFQAISTMA